MPQFAAVNTAAAVIAATMTTTNTTIRIPTNTTTLTLAGPFLEGLSNLSRGSR